MTAQQAADLLRAQDDILILTHRHPDGDTLGSAYALCLGLQAIGKRARVAVVGDLPQKYDYMAQQVPLQDFEPHTVCSVDVADRALLGEENAALYGDRVLLSIDHHGTSRLFAGHTFCVGCAATVMLVRQVLHQLGVSLTAAMADCLYTGLATDTGCFRYANTDKPAFLLAAELVEAGADTEKINRLMFETKSRATLQLEQLALQTLQYYFDGRVAVMTITRDMMQQCGADDAALDGLSAIPRQIEGVWAGITMRQTPQDAFKISLRSNAQVDSAAVCAALGGGGHARAAGCTVQGSSEQACQAVLQALARQYPEMAL